jgi:hypothetical protein
VAARRSHSRSRGPPWQAVAAALSPDSASQGRCPPFTPGLPPLPPPALRLSLSLSLSPLLCNSKRNRDRNGPEAHTGTVSVSVSVTMSLCASQSRPVSGPPDVFSIRSAGGRPGILGTDAVRRVYVMNVRYVQAPVACGDVRDSDAMGRRRMPAPGYARVDAAAGRAVDCCTAAHAVTRRRRDRMAV